MDKKEFKKALADTLSEYGFVTTSNIARVETDKLIIVVSTQKSNFENSYYLNYGFVIKELNPKLINPKDNQCDVFGRLNLTIDSKMFMLVEYEKISRKEFSTALKFSINEKINPVLKSGLQKYFELFPSAVSTVGLRAKEYLELL